jgi:putative two-component system response regulator
MNIENMKIISIDDNKTNLLIIESYAKTLSLQIDSFLEPKEALLVTTNVEYDLVIVDYMMPEMNGLEFIQEFRKNNPSLVSERRFTFPKSLEKIKMAILWPWKL